MLQASGRHPLQGWRSRRSGPDPRRWRDSCRYSASTITPGRVRRAHRASPIRAARGLHLEIHNEGDLGGGTRSGAGLFRSSFRAMPPTVDGYLGIGALGGTRLFDYHQLDMSGYGRADSGAFGYEECTDSGTGGSQPGQLSVLGGLLVSATGGADPGHDPAGSGESRGGGPFGLPRCRIRRRISSSDNTLRGQLGALLLLRTLRREQGQKQRARALAVARPSSRAAHPILAEQTVNVSRGGGGATLSETFQIVHTPLRPQF